MSKHRKKREKRTSGAMDGWTDDDMYAWQTLLSIMSPQEPTSAAASGPFGTMAMTLLFDLRDRGFRIRRGGPELAAEQLPIDAVLPDGWTHADAIGCWQLGEVLAGHLPDGSDDMPKRAAIGLSLELRERGLRIVFIPDAKAAA